MIANGDLFQCFVSEAANKDIVSFASFFFAYYSWNGKSIYLDDLYVTDAYRKQGIGKLFLEEIVALAKKVTVKNCVGRFQNGTPMPLISTKE